MTDYDKLIDRQLERAAITTITGFAKIFTDAPRCLKYKIYTKFKLILQPFVPQEAIK